MKKLKLTPQGSILLFNGNTGRTAKPTDWINLTAENIRITEIDNYGLSAQYKSEIGVFKFGLTDDFRFDVYPSGSELVNDKHWEELEEAVINCDLFKGAIKICKGLDRLGPTYYPEKGFVTDGTWGFKVAE